MPIASPDMEVSEYPLLRRMERTAILRWFVNIREVFFRFAMCYRIARPLRVGHIESKQDKAQETQCKPNDVDERKRSVSEEVPKANSEIVEQHGWGVKV